MIFRTILIALAFLIISTSHARAGELSQAEEVCLTKAIYHESRGESDKGMFAVASVILNRSESDRYPSDVCSVIAQRGQFTYDKKAKMTEPDALAKVRSVVAAIQEDFIPKHQFMYFHNRKVIGPCSSKRNKVLIGNHVFCQ